VSEQLAALVALALHEDLEHGGDVTASATVPATATATGRVVARAGGVLAGLEAAHAVAQAVDPRLELVAHAHDGDALEADQPVLDLSGAARSVLAAERTLLNFLGHLSGVATLTARYVEELAGTRCILRDTRKTTPGMRELEKAAVRAGGGMNHRMGLFDGVLVKDNHVAACGGVLEAARQALAYVRTSGREVGVQIEVDDLDQLRQALTAGARVVLLDNFSLGRLREAVTICRDEREYVFAEASGGITLENVREVALTGVDAVAVGAVTHSAPALDLGMDWLGVDGEA
jgi:nicotinate-nucleotide pyrophosphorylase (carboxylating)